MELAAHRCLLFCRRRRITAVARGSALQQANNLVGPPAQRVDSARIQDLRLRRHDAKSADNVAAGADQRRTGLEAQGHRRVDERMFPGSFVCAQVLNDQDVALREDELAESTFYRSLRWNRLRHAARLQGVLIGPV